MPPSPSPSPGSQQQQQEMLNTLTADLKALQGYNESLKKALAAKRLQPSSAPPTTPPPPPPPAAAQATSPAAYAAAAPSPTAEPQAAGKQLSQAQAQSIARKQALRSGVAVSPPPPPPRPPRTDGVEPVARDGRQPLTVEGTASSRTDDVSLSSRLPPADTHRSDSERDATQALRESVAALQVQFEEERSRHAQTEGLLQSELASLRLEATRRRLQESPPPRSLSYSDATPQDAAAATAATVLDLENQVQSLRRREEELQRELRTYVVESNRVTALLAESQRNHNAVVLGLEQQLRDGETDMANARLRHQEEMVHMHQQVLSNASFEQKQLERRLREEHEEEKQRLREQWTAEEARRRETALSERSSALAAELQKTCEAQLEQLRLQMALEREQRELALQKEHERVKAAMAEDIRRLSVAVGMNEQLLQAAKQEVSQQQKLIEELTRRHVADEEKYVSLTKVIDRAREEHRLEAARLESNHRQAMAAVEDAGRQHVMDVQQSMESQHREQIENLMFQFGNDARQQQQQFQLHLEREKQDAVRAAVDQIIKDRDLEQQQAALKLQLLSDEKQACVSEAETAKHRQIEETAIQFQKKLDMLQAALAHSNSHHDIVVRGLQDQIVSLTGQCDHLRRLVDEKEAERSELFQRLALLQTASSSSVGSNNSINNSINNNNNGGAAFFSPPGRPDGTPHAHPSAASTSPSPRAAPVGTASVSMTESVRLRRELSDATSQLESARDEIHRLATDVAALQQDCALLRQRYADEMAHAQAKSEESLRAERSRSTVLMDQLQESHETAFRDLVAQWDDREKRMLQQHERQLEGELSRLCEDLKRQHEQREREQTAAAQSAMERSLREQESLLRSEAQRVLDERLSRQRADLESKFHEQFDAVVASHIAGTQQKESFLAREHALALGSSRVQMTEETVRLLDLVHGLIASVAGLSSSAVAAAPATAASRSSIAPASLLMRGLEETCKELDAEYKSLFSMERDRMVLDAEQRQQSALLELEERSRKQLEAASDGWNTQTQLQLQEERRRLMQAAHLDKQREVDELRQRLTEDHALELKTKLHDARKSVEEKLVRTHEVQMQEMQARHAEELLDLQRQRDEQASVQVAAACREADARHELLLRQREKELVDRHEAALLALEKSRADELQAMRAGHEQALAKMEETMAQHMDHELQLFAAARQQSEEKLRMNLRELSSRLRSAQKEHESHVAALEESRRQDMLRLQQEWEARMLQGQERLEAAWKERLAALSAEWDRRLADVQLEVSKKEEAFSACKEKSTADLETAAQEASAARAAHALEMAELQRHNEEKVAGLEAEHEQALRKLQQDEQARLLRVQEDLARCVGDCRAAQEHVTQSDRSREAVMEELRRSSSEVHHWRDVVCEDLRRHVEELQAGFHDSQEKLAETLDRSSRLENQNAHLKDELDRLSKGKLSLMEMVGNLQEEGVRERGRWEKTVETLNVQLRQVQQMLLAMQATQRIFKESGGSDLSLGAAGQSGGGAGMYYQEQIAVMQRRMQALVQENAVMVAAVSRLKGYNTAASGPSPL